MPLTIDGSNEANTGGAASLAVVLTTTLPNDLICVAVLANASVTSVTAPGLTLLPAPGLGVNEGGNFLDLYTAVASAPLSALTITVNLSGSTFATVIAFGINGANNASPFDAAAVTGATDPVAINVSLTAASVMVLGLFSNTIANGAGYTQIESSSNFLMVEYQVVTPPQTGLSVTTSGPGTTSAAAAIAIKAAAAGVAAVKSALGLMMMGVG